MSPKSRKPSRASHERARASSVVAQSISPSTLPFEQLGAGVVRVLFDVNGHEGLVSSFGNTAAEAALACARALRVALGTESSGGRDDLIDVGDGDMVAAVRGIELLIELSRAAHRSVATAADMQFSRGQ